jgi:superfamily II DNA or RNA helicase
LSPALEMLLIQRSRIAKQAAGKPTLAVNILGNRYRPGERWLVYCDDRTQLQTVRQGLTNRGLHSFEYWSAMHSHGPDVLARFSRSGGILVAIRCLDEGIDIPSVSHALILASSQNPREFIQRRGRVLRVSPGKDIAVIHDVLVSPPSVNGASFRNLALAEIRRAHEFAQHAENLSAALMLDAFAAEWGVNWDDVVDDGVEADPLEEEEVESGSGV